MVKTTVNESANNEANPEKASRNLDDTINRNLVLTWLKEDVEWLRKKMRNDNPIKNPVRVQLARASIYGCSTILAALKDQEIDQLMSEIMKIKAHIGMKE